MNRRFLAFTVAGAAAVAALIVAGCRDEGDDLFSPTATPPPPEVTATPVPPERGTPAVRPSGTVSPAGATATRPAGSPAASSPVFSGSTNPVTLAGNPQGTALLRDVRAGAQPAEGYDRIVLEFSGNGTPPVDVRYVTSATECGSGKTVSVGGSAMLQVKIDRAAAHTEAGQPTFAPRQVNGTGGSIVEVKATCDFEGQVGWVAGLNGRQPFRVTTLQNPTRIVVDVKR